MIFRLKPFIKRRLERQVFSGLPLTIFVIVFVILFGTFIGITNAIVNSAAMVKIDDWFAHFIYSYRTPFFAQIFYVITNFANQITVGILLAISLVYVYVKKEIAYLYALLLTCIGTEGSVFLIKIFINRARPGSDIAYYLESSKSFPSGHSAIAMAFFGFITYYVIRHITGGHKKSFVIFCGTLLIALIGFSRLYLDVHYLSDVIGGFLIGGLWLVVGITFDERNFYTTSIKKIKTKKF